MVQVKGHQSAAGGDSGRGHLAEIIQAGGQAVAGESLQEGINTGRNQFTGCEVQDIFINIKCP